MSNYIQNVEQIKTAADIKEVVGRFVSLGKDDKACCPFHDEKTASFSIDIKKGIYKCFGCGAGGDSIRFVMQYQKVPYMEAVEIVADICRIDVVRETDYSTLEKEIKTFRAATTEEEEGKYYYEIKDGFDEYELKELFPRYNDKLEEKVKEKYVQKLKEMNFHPLKSITYIKNRKAITTSTHPRFPIFLIDHGSFKKIYKPKEKEKQYRFLYIGEKPKDHINGLTQMIKAYEKHNAKKKQEQGSFDEESGEVFHPVEEKLEEVVICSGERDSMNVYVMGYNVVWLNSESAILTEKQYNTLKKYAKKVYNLPDIDTTGLREGHRLATEYLDILTIWLPDDLAEKKDWRGKRCKDLTDYMKYYNQYDFKKLFENALPYKFWDEKPRFNKEGKYLGSDYEFNNVCAYNFLSKNGFIRYRDSEDKSDFMFVHYDKGVVQEITSNDVKMFIHNFLEDRMMDIRLRNAMYKTNQLNDNSLSNLNFKKLDFTSFNRNQQMVFFKNKTLKINASGIEEIKFEDIDTFVWKDKLIDHDFKMVDDMFKVSMNQHTGMYEFTAINTDCIFFKYIINTSRVHWQKEIEDKKPLTEEEIYEQDMHMINKIYCIGYLLHRYKDPNRAWSVFAMDNKISEEGESNGGSGKSILFNQAIRLMQRVFYISGRNKKIIDNPHIFDGVTKDTDYVLIDDCDRYLRFDFFFNFITGDLPVNPKGKQPFVIPYGESPKLVFTSNFTPDKSDGSTQRRILYTVFSDWYHDNTNEEYQKAHTPLDDFGLNMFTDFDEHQWNLFYNFMLQCVKTYLNYSKINPPMGNVHKRNLLQKMSEAFKSWADVYIMDRLNQEIDRMEAFNDFVEKTKLNKFTTNAFTTRVKSWASYYGYEYNPDSVATDGRIIKKKDGKATEYFYIKGEHVLVTTEDEKEPF
jgi:5S rRNA maturation endonuclease (ribonuclease M5)